MTTSRAFYIAAAISYGGILLDWLYQTPLACIANIIGVFAMLYILGLQHGKGSQ